MRRLIPWIAVSVFHFFVSGYLIIGMLMSSFGNTSGANEDLLVRTIMHVLYYAFLLPVLGLFEGMGDSGLMLGLIALSIFWGWAVLSLIDKWRARRAKVPPAGQ